MASYQQMMLEVWLVLWMGKGLAKGLVGIQFHHTKAQSIQLIWAPESMIAVVSTAFIVSGETMNFNGMYKEFFHCGVLWMIMGSSCIEVVLPFKIQVIFFLGELSYDSFLIFFSYFFDRGSGFDHCYFLGGEAGRGMSRERRRVHEVRTGCSHVAFLLASETSSFPEALLPFFESEFPGFFFGIYVHGIGVPGGSTSGRGRGMECDRGSGRVLFHDQGCKVSLTKKLVDFLIPSFGCGGDYFHAVDSV